MKREGVCRFPPGNILMCTGWFFLRMGYTKEAISFNFKYKCIADVLFINITNFSECDQFPVLNQRLQTPHIPHIWLKRSSQYQSLCKREEFDFEIINFSILSTYGVYISHVICRSFQLQLKLRLVKRHQCLNQKIFNVYLINNTGWSWIIDSKCWIFFYFIVLP